MSEDEAVAMLQERLGLSAAAVGEELAAAGRKVLATAAPADANLPTSWFEVYERVEAANKRPGAGVAADTASTFLAASGRRSAFETGGRKPLRHAGRHQSAGDSPAGRRESPS